jgi:hypothetical protein
MSVARSEAILETVVDIGALPEWRYKEESSK